MNNKIKNFINLRNNEGGIINGYNPYILRPPNTVFIEKSGCDSPLFTKTTKSNWCDENVAQYFYNMRPLMLPNQYEEMIEIIKSKLIDFNFDKKIIKNVEQSEFCYGSKQLVMGFIMKEIEKIILNNPIFQKNGGFKYESFYPIDEFFTRFEINNGTGLLYKVIFNLFNNLRNVSTLIESNIVDLKKNNDLKIIKFDIISKKDGDNLEGFDFLKRNKDSKMGSSIKTSFCPRPIEVEWNYKNTLLKQDFNKHGYFDEKNNVKLQKYRNTKNLKEYYK